MRSHSIYAFVGVNLHTLFVTPALAQSQASANCTVFNWNQQPGYIINGTTSRVSGASSCPSTTHDCPIVVAGEDQFSSSYNVSSILPNSYWVGSDKYSHSFLHDLILATVNASLDGQLWPDSAIASVGTTQALSPGTSGYVNFTLFDRCFEGTMSNCTGGIKENLPIRACAPVVLSLYGTDSQDVFAGRYTVVQIPEADVGRYSNPLAGQARGAAMSVQPHIGVALAALAMAVAISI